MPYLYDAFFSYKRHPQTDRWHQTVKEKIEYWLQQELNQRVVRVFFDTEDIRTGNRWKAKVVNGLKQSKCIACVWSPTYFQSKYCVSEWQTFLEREALYNLELVVPASFHDGTSFPPKALDAQIRDFSNYASTMPRFWDTELAVEFEQRILRPYVRDLAALIRNAPPFDPNFPVVEAPDEDVMEEPAIERVA